MCTATILRDKGLRVTQQRVMIYEILDKNRIHPTIDMLYNIVSEIDSSIGIATVYKTIDAFKSHDIVRELKCDNTPSRYDINNTNHAHFECSSCGEFEDLMFVNVSSLLSKHNNEENYVLKNANIVFTGNCPVCAGKA